MIHQFSKNDTDANNFKIRRCSARIHSINSIGLMMIKFSENMKTNMTLTGSELNSTYLDIFITPSDGIDGLKQRDLNLTWNATSFNNSSLEIQLNFSSPLNISSNLVYDNITVHVINFTNMFQSQTNLYLDMVSKNMTSKVRKQMYNNKNSQRLIITAQMAKYLI